MSINIRDAMNTLSNMFPFIERDVIMHVLQAHNGNLEATVSTLLEMGKPKIPTGTVIQSTYATYSPPGPRASQASSTTTTSTPMGPPMGTVVQRASAPVKNQQPRSHNSAPRTILPDDFLRPPSYFKKAAPNASQDDQDALLAQMLQDEWFLRDLQQNPQRYGQQPHPSQQSHPSQQPLGPKGVPMGYKPPTTTPPVATSASSTTSSTTSSSSTSTSSFPSTSTSSSLSTPLIGSSSSDPSYTPDVSGQGSAQEASFAEKFSRLGENARKKLALFASKLKKSDNNQQATSDNMYKELPSMDDEPALGDDDEGEGKKKRFFEMKDFGKNKKNQKPLSDDQEYGSSSEYVSLPEAQPSINSSSYFTRPVTSSSST